MSRIKLTRMQKVLRNVLLAAVCLFLLEWMWSFPSLSRSGLLRRAERSYFLADSELLFTAEEEDRTTIYAQNGTALLAVSGELTPLGWRLEAVEIARQEDGILCVPEDVYGGFQYLVFGDVAGAARAELEVLLEEELTMNGEYVGKLKEVYTARGERIAPGGFVFKLARQYEDADISPPARVEKHLFESGGRLHRTRPILRLYDEHDTLIYEKEMGNNYFIYVWVWPEVEA